jgi:hypothetical protein
MALQTGENEQALRKIMDFTRLLSVIILLIHFYLLFHLVFEQWGYAAPWIDILLSRISRMAIFQSSLYAKGASLLLLLISLLGAKGRKNEAIRKGSVITSMLAGLFLYFISDWAMSKLDIDITFLAVGYIAFSSLGYLLVLTGGIRLSRLIQLQLNGDIFNQLNESFPQEERLLENEFSINLPARYQLKGKERRSWINVINPFRGLLVVGTPGAGKSYFVIRHVITQHLRKGFTMFVYDFKYDDLSRIAYNTLLKYRHQYPIAPQFYVINFDDLSRTHRCNPLDPASMHDITDATEAARTIMLGLNREWIKKQGEFFVESPINFVTAIIWFLRKYQNGRYCTLPHVIELMQTEYDQLFPVLRTEPEIEVLINPFVSAYVHEAWEQLEGQVASAKIGMARLSSPQLYFVLSGNDFTLDVNNPEAPKVVCVGNNPQKSQVYGAVLSLYISRIIKLVNRKKQQKCSLVFDEFPTIYFNGIDSLIATARSNQVATTLGVQDYSQLKKDYGREQAEVVMNIVGNLISGQVVGETARQLSERFGKIIQQRESVSVNSSDTSISKSTQLDAAIPPSKIAALSSGEFVGMVADNPDQKIDLKVFHAEILNDHQALRKEEENYFDIPAVRKVDATEVQKNYARIKEDIQRIVEETLATINDK